VKKQKQDVLFWKKRTKKLLLPFGACREDKARSGTARFAKPVDKAPAQN